MVVPVIPTLLRLLLLLSYQSIYALSHLLHPDPLAPVLFPDSRTQRENVRPCVLKPDNARPWSHGAARSARVPCCIGMGKRIALRVGSVCGLVRCLRGMARRCAVLLLLCRHWD